MPTYGMPELTGWISCRNCTPYLYGQQHPSEKLFYKNSSVKAIARSLLKYRSKWKVADGKVSKRDYYADIVLSPKVVKPVEYNDLMLRIRLVNNISVVHPVLTMLEETATLGCRYILVKLHESRFSTSALLTVTISNSGEVSNHN
jgi:hypothetical protein